MTTLDIKKEECANTWTHVVGIVLAVAVAYPMLRAAAAYSPMMLLGMILCELGMLDMYISSTLYHIMPHDTKAKRIVRYFDHSSIYVMIAGCYSPICTGLLGGWVGWSTFAFLWLCVIVGTIGKVVALGKYPRLSLLLYLLMGWVALLIIYPLWLKMPLSAFCWMFAEGIFYSIGSYFFSKDEEHAFYHAIWHVFILLGTASHLVAMCIVMGMF